MPYVRIKLHLVWSTKYFRPIITRQFKPLLLDQIRDISRRNGIYIDTMNCVSDHIHILLSLTNEQKLSEVVKKIKGGSSYWVNKENILKFPFAWQDGYWAVSVGENGLAPLRAYIKNQEEHHRKKHLWKSVKTFSTLRSESE